MKNNKLNIFDLIDLFSKKTGCSAQEKGCPCNTCFHNLSNEIDFKHIVWLILLGLRGDYEKKEIIDTISEELKK